MRQSLPIFHAYWMQFFQKTGSYWPWFFTNSTYLCGSYLLFEHFITVYVGARIANIVIDFYKTNEWRKMFKTNEMVEFQYKLFRCCSALDCLHWLPNRILSVVRTLNISLYDPVKSRSLYFSNNRLLFLIWANGAMTRSMKKKWWLAST